MWRRGTRRRLPLGALLKKLMMMMWLTGLVGVGGRGTAERGTAGRDGNQTLLDATVKLLSGPGPSAHRIWLPPLSEPPTLDQLLGPAGSGGGGAAPVRGGV